jgi:hypothetical protein
MNDHPELENLVRSADKDGLESALREHSVPERVLSHLLFVAVRSFERKHVEEMFECLDILLRNKANPAFMEGGRTLLTEAVFLKGHVDLVHKLLERGQKADRPDDHRKNALVYAIERRPEDASLVEELLHCERVAESVYEVNPLVLALSLGKFRIARKLIEAGPAFINGANEAGNTPLHLVLMA